MSIFWPEPLVDRRVPNPQTDVEKMAYYNANQQYTMDKNAWMLGIAARIVVVVVVGGYVVYRAAKPRRLSGHRRMLR